MALASRTEAVESIRQRVDIVDFVARYVKLKKAGNNYVGVCPFHPDKSPSMSVSSQKGFFHCFGCKASGDIFSFLMKLEGKTFPEAVEELAGIAGVELPRRYGDFDRNREIEQRLFGVNEAATNYFETQMWKGGSGKRARDYIAKRRLHDQAAKDFRLGYAPSGWNNFTGYLDQNAPRLQTSMDEIESLGLVARGSRGFYDVFRDRIVFPIIGLNDKVVGFGARLLSSDDKAPKYLNSRQSRTFDKSEILYGLRQGRKSIQTTGEAILVEGYFDVLSLVEAGFNNVVATCGTALTDRHARILRRFTDKVVTVFDADAAGTKASLRSAEILLKENISPYMVTLPKGEDPDTFVHRYGKQKLKELIVGAKPTVEVLTDAIRQTQTLDIETRTQETRKLLPLLAACRDRLRLGNYLSWVSQQLGLEERTLYNAVEEQRKTQGHTVVDIPVEPVSAPAGETIRREEEDSLVLLVKYPRLVSTITESDCLDKFESFTVRRIIEQLVDCDHDVSAASIFSDIQDEQLHSRIGAKLMNDTEFPEKTAASHLEDCIRAIRLRWVKEQICKLQSDIQKAETSGEKHESDRMKRLKIRLMKEKESLGSRI